MKKHLGLFIIFFQFICSGFLFAEGNDSPNIINRDKNKEIPKSLFNIISIDLDNAPLEKTLLTIAEKGKFKLNFNRKDIPVYKKVSVKMDNVPAIKVLNKVLIDTDTEFVITKGGLFAVVPKEKKKSKSGTISGKVSESYNNRKIPGVYIQVMNTKLSTISDENGEFKILSVPVGSYNIKFSVEGFKTVIKTDVIIRSKRISFVDVKMAEQFLQIKETVEVSGSYFPVDEKNPVSVVTISSEEVRRAPGTGGGITRMLKVLPGITTADDENTDLIVRGGSPYENGYIIDNIEIPAISHLPRLASGGSFSALQADLIQNVNIYTGGFSSNYGDSLSSITDITIREGNRDEFDGQLDLHMAGAGFIFEGPISKDRGSWLVSLRRFDMKIIKDFISIGGSPATTDAQFKMSYDISPTQKINFLYFHLSGHIYEGGSWIQSKLKCSLHTVGINWMSIWNPNFFSYTSLAFTSFRKLNGERYFYIYPDTFPLVEKIWDIWDVDDLSGTLSLRNSNYLVLNNQNKLEFGLQVKHESDRLEEVFYPLTDSPYPLPDSNRDWTKRNQINYNYNTTKFGLFFSYIGTFFKRLTTTIGLRGDYSSAHDIFHLSPRFSLRYKINPHLSLSGGAGLFYQTLPTAFLAYIPSAASLKDMKAAHYTLGMEWLLGHGTRLILEGYIKNYDNLPISPDNNRWLAMDYTVALFRDNMYLPVGYRAPKILDDGSSGYSRGIELLIQKKLTNKFYGFLSASFFRCKYKDLMGETHNRVYDNRCIINLSCGYKPNRYWEFSARWTIVGGGPYTPIDVEASRQCNGWILDDSRFLRSRYPTYNSLNLRVDKRFFFSGSNLTLFLDLWNALNNKNVHFYWWESGSSQIKTANQIEFMPIFGVEFEF